MSNILQRDGLTIELLARLSYKSELGINLKKNLHYFEKDALVEELINLLCYINFGYKLVIKAQSIPRNF